VGKAMEVKRNPNLLLFYGEPVGFLRKFHCTFPDHKENMKVNILLEYLAHLEPKK
jgi:hypothetical protein